MPTQLDPFSGPPKAHPAAVRLSASWVPNPEASSPLIPRGESRLSPPHPRLLHHSSHLPAPQSYWRAPAISGRGKQGPAVAWGDRVGAATHSDSPPSSTSSISAPRALPGRRHRGRRHLRSLSFPVAEAREHCGDCSSPCLVPALLPVTHVPGWTRCSRYPWIVGGPTGKTLGLLLVYRGLVSCKKLYLRRQLLEHLSLLTPTSAAAHQSTRVGDAVMKALGSAGGTTPA